MLRDKGLRLMYSRLRVLQLVESLYRIHCWPLWEQGAVRHFVVRGRGSYTLCSTVSVINF